MGEKAKAAEPQAEYVSSAGENHTPEEREVTIPVKFNKEEKSLTAAEAATLAQKGMKFEIIENEFERLKSIAAKEGKSVPAFIDDLEKKHTAARRDEILAECAGNEALADHVLELENAKPQSDGLSELKEYFPTVKSLDDLPRAVVESARLKGENLLNAYLRFRLIKKRQSEKEKLFEKAAENASIGSLKGPFSAGDDTFIKALWGR